MKRCFVFAMMGLTIISVEGAEAVSTACSCGAAGLPKDYAANTVPGEGQIRSSGLVRFEGEGRKGGLLVIGSSYAWHGPKPDELGWNGDWGMAASAREKDAAHVLWNAVKRVNPAAPLCIAQCANWERNYTGDVELLERDFAAVKSFRPDWICVITTVGNAQPDFAKRHPIAGHYETMVEWFRQLNPRAKVVLSVTDRIPEIGAAVRQYGKGHGFPIVDHGFLNEPDSGYRAYGLCRHPGVAWHPSDKGHAEMASRYCEALGLNVDVTKTCECRPRGGLPNVLAKLKAGETVRIAYLGGSITEAGGWRPMTLAWFRSAFPQAKVEEIDASISGTGSDYGAIRLPNDVLAKKPDLLFVEFRVNGSAGYDYQSTEGIVRQTFAADPKTDVCFVYTLCEAQLEELAVGRQTTFGQAMERVCDHYGIPSIDFAPEIVRRMKDPTAFAFKPTRHALTAEAIQMDGRAKKAVQDPDAGKIVFAMDGVHPGKEGHQIYCDVVARSMTDLIFPASGEARAHVMPPQLSKSAWIAAETFPATNVLTGAAWTFIADKRKDPVYGDTFWRTERMLRGGVWTTQEGTVFRIKWVGNTLGFSDIPQAKAGEPPIEIEVVVDGGKPLVYRRARTPESRIYSRFVYLPEYAWGEHEAVFTVKKVPSGQRCIFGQFLVVGHVIR